MKLADIYNLIEYSFPNTGIFAFGYLFSLRSKEIYYSFWDSSNVFDIQWGNTLPYEASAQIRIIFYFFYFVTMQVTQSL